ncbi:MAG TPA: lysoplasmalogenase [Bryobacteraceae bacterium]|nr:lysoplasmalogenase [Bryobacteraceae bacterium]
MRGISRITGREVCLAVSAAAAAGYLLVQRWQPVPGGALLKGVPVGSLAVLALLARGIRRDAALLALGLAFSTAGDVLLDLDPDYFVFGLGAFLLTHLIYVGLFARNRAAGIHLDPPHLAALLLVLAYSATLSAWIVPSVGALGVPVVFYICAITTMVCTAILARFTQRWVAVGAVLFLVSDSLLAIDKFKMPVPARDYLVWITYYAGQCGIALGYLESS